MTREDIIVLCEEAIAQLEYEGEEEGKIWETLLEARAYLINEEEGKK